MHIKSKSKSITNFLLQNGQKKINENLFLDSEYIVLKRHFK